MERQDPLIGTWERYGDGAEGTIIRVTKIKDSYEGVLEEVTGKLKLINFKIGQKKWSQIKLDHDSIYRGKDKTSYNETFEDVDMEIHIYSNELLVIDHEKETEFGRHQTWKKLKENHRNIAGQYHTYLDGPNTTKTEFDLTLEVNGNKVSGTYKFNKGSFDGSFESYSIVKGHWTEEKVPKRPKTNWGTYQFTFYVQNGIMKFHGSYGFETEEPYDKEGKPRHEWNGRRFSPLVKRAN
ncbi:hypothetical protein Ga0466249_004762 [Sporomusaceae bacterium BoRhaA]|nr:hypothetical protein [Pelorhabdus rhamnosifermentans]